MAQIRIERTPIKAYGLGFFGADHLQLTYVVDEFASPLVQDNWFVIEGLKGTGEINVIGVEGTDGVTTLSEANAGLAGDALIAVMGTPKSRNSTVIDLPLGAFESWSTMAEFGADIDEQFLPYLFASQPLSPLPTSNSSSVIATLLFHIGVDLSSILSLPLGRHTTGIHTLLGSSGRDELSTSDSFKSILGGYGSDILHGRDGIDRLHGGRDADYFFWSKGLDFLHGGEKNLAYADDGIDVVGYGGVGTIRIEYNPFWQAHKMANFITYYDGGRDLLFSIERIEWDNGTDNIVLGKGVELIQDNILFDLKGDGGGKGDKVSFSEASESLLINAVDGDTLVAQSAQSEAPDKGMFIQSVEWIEGSGFDDRIYANSALRAIDGGAGDDFIDARLDSAFAGGAPSGFDLEILGGEGNDTILSGEGRTFVNGGSGADRIVFTTVNTGNGTPELVIDGGDSEDRLFIAYNFFNGSGGGFEGSELMPVLGGMFPFEVLEDPEGPGSLSFDWQLMDDILNGDSQVEGLIDFVGHIIYTLEGNDLLIHLRQGVTEVVNLAEDGLPPNYFTVIQTDPEVEAIIRILNFTPGDLGIEFHDPGEPESRPNGIYYPNWDSSINTLLNNGEMLDPFDARPAAPVYTEPTYEGSSGGVETSGTESDDVIVLAQAGNVRAGGGNDQITGSAASDRIDGGSGADALAGGRGDDAYIVDHAGDVVVEFAGEGTDTVNSSVDQVLSAHAENLVLTGAALLGTGNALGNRITGNDHDNVLDGGAGRDTLSGGLGDDILIGGDGSDTYVYISGEGDDLVIDTGAALDIDTLAMGHGITEADLTLYRTADAPQDLVIAVAGGGRVIIKDYAGANGVGIEQVTFDDGTLWGRAAIEAYGAAAPVFGSSLPQAITDDLVVVASPIGLIDPSNLLANDRDPDGDPLTIVAVGDAIGGVVTLDPDGRIRVATSEGFEGLVTFTYTISDPTGGTSSASVAVEVVPNTDPFAIGSIPDISATATEAMDVTLPGGIFGDADGDQLFISATLADGAPLPAWLTFNPTQGRLTGTPPPEAEGQLSIKIEVTDGLATASHQFVLAITPLSVPGVTVAGTSGNDALAGGAGDDIFTLIGDGGIDTIDGGAGTDTVRGSIYNDIVRLTAGPANFTSIEVIDGGDGNDRILGGAGDDTIDASPFTLVSLELIDGGAGNDTITGSAGDDTITGNTGNDVLFGGDGNDVFTLAGDGGYDTIDGGAGNDTVRGSVYNDNIRIATGLSGLTSIEIVDGGLGNDRILGGSGADNIDLSGMVLISVEQIDGGAGNDTIVGSAGNDVITGNSGNDLLFGGEGDDVFTLAGDGGYDTIDGGAGFDTIRGSIYHDVIRVASGQASFTGIEAIDGGDGFDRILGSAAHDTIDLGGLILTAIEHIDAGAGNDTIVASASNDLLLGGSGSDTFVFAALTGHDTIADFKIHALGGTDADVVDLGGAGFADFAAIMAAATQDGGDTLITLDAGHSIRLNAVSKSALTLDDFSL